MIDIFKMQYAFLSNTHPVDIELDGEIYPTLEHAFQASKTTNPEDRERIRMAKTPVSARSIGKKIVLRTGWDYSRVRVMETLLRVKFSNAELQEKLALTVGEELVEGNSSHDQYWGKCNCVNHKGEGLNWLGRLLMKIRDEDKTPKA